MEDLLRPVVAGLGRHILAEFWGCVNIENPEKVENAIVSASRMAGATVLGVNVHHFGEGMGVTGVVMLAESHLSIHSWPEIGYAAIDVFVCGKADPHKAIDHLKQAFLPNRAEVREFSRGEMAHA